MKNLRQTIGLFILVFMTGCTQLPTSDEVWYKSESNQFIPIDRVEWARSGNEPFIGMQKNGEFFVIKFASPIENLDIGLFADSDISELYLPSTVESLDIPNNYSSSEDEYAKLQKIYHINPKGVIGDPYYTEVKKGKAGDKSLWSDHPEAEYKEDLDWMQGLWMSKKSADDFIFIQGDELAVFSSFESFDKSLLKPYKLYGDKVVLAEDSGNVIMTLDRDHTFREYQSFVDGYFDKNQYALFERKEDNDTYQVGIYLIQRNLFRGCLTKNETLERLFQASFDGDTLKNKTYYVKEKATLSSEGWNISFDVEHSNAVLCKKGESDKYFFVDIPVKAEMETNFDIIGRTIEIRTPGSFSDWTESFSGTTGGPWLVGKWTQHLPGMPYFITFQGNGWKGDCYEYDGYSFNAGTYKVDDCWINCDFGDGVTTTFTIEPYRRINAGHGYYMRGSSTGTKQPDFVGSFGGVSTERSNGDFSVTIGDLAYYQLRPSNNIKSFNYYQTYTVHEGNVAVPSTVHISDNKVYENEKDMSKQENAGDALSRLKAVMGKEYADIWPVKVVHFELNDPSLKDTDTGMYCLLYKWYDKKGRMIHVCGPESEIVCYNDLNKVSDVYFEDYTDGTMVRISYGYYSHEKDLTEYRRYNNDKCIMDMSLITDEDSYYLVERKDVKGNWDGYNWVGEDGILCSSVEYK